MIHPRWTIAIGCVSAITVLYFWLTMFVAVGWLRQKPGDLFPLLIGICLSAALSVPAAVKGQSGGISTAPHVAASTLLRRFRG